MKVNPIRKAYIAAGWIIPCPIRNRPHLNLKQLLDHGYHYAAAAKAQREVDGE